VEIHHDASNGLIRRTYGQFGRREQLEGALSNVRVAQEPIAVTNTTSHR
jgi:hypothetical protein